MLKNTKENILDAIFPRFCVRCGSSGSLLCEECFSLWQISRAGKVNTAPNELCLHVFTFAYADKIARDLICAWKYEYDFSAWEILKRKILPELGLLNQIILANNIQAVVPVPLHEKKYLQRGFDQAEEISRFIANELFLPCMPVLGRVRSTGKQAERSDEERVMEMLKSPFECNFDCPKRILLIDDVWTTGSTSAAAVRTLQRAGADCVITYTLAKG